MRQAKIFRVEHGYWIEIQDGAAVLDTKFVQTLWGARRWSRRKMASDSLPLRELVDVIPEVDESDEELDQTAARLVMNSVAARRSELLDRLKRDD